VLPDEDAAREGDIRVVDESGEDYLYPAKDFVVIEVPAEVHEPGAEPLQAAGFCAVQSRGTYLGPEDWDGRVGDPGRGQEPRALQVPDRRFDVPPRGLLHQERPDNHLEPRLRGPPVLWPESPEELLVRRERHVHIHWENAPRGKRFLSEPFSRGHRIAARWRARRTCSAP